MALERIVIVGGGLAALRAAERLAEHRFRGSIVIIGDEPRRPYNRPPLSKQLLTGRTHPENLRFATTTKVQADWRLGESAAALDPENQTVITAAGEAITYDGLVIATGVHARTLPNLPTRGRIHTLRSLPDSRELDTDLATTEHLAIVGGGFIGGEVATSARSRAIPVTIIDVSPTLMHHAVGDVVGAVIDQIHLDAGVTLRLGSGVAAIADLGDHYRISTADSSEVEADTVLVGVGTAPNVAWLEGHGLDLSDGVLCDDRCRVIGLQNTVAAGDIARWPNTRFDDVPRRTEHWMNATEQARHAIDALVTPESTPAFKPVPRFWSEQHGVKIQSVGIPKLGDEVHIAEGATSRRQFVATYLRDANLMGAIAVDAPRSLLSYYDQVGMPWHELQGQHR